MAYGFAWTRGHARLDTMLNAKIDNNIIHFDSFDRGDVDVYTCTTTGLEGASQTSVAFDYHFNYVHLINEKGRSPKIIEIYKIGIEKANQPFRLHCLINNLNFSRVQWSYKGQRLPSETNEVLMFDSLQYADQGEYECVAYNSHGTEKKKVEIALIADSSSSIQLVNKNRVHKTNTIHIELLSAPSELKKYGLLKMQCLSSNYCNSFIQLNVSVLFKIKIYIKYHETFNKN